MQKCETHPFERSGLGARSDLESREIDDLLKLLDREQREFLSVESKFRSPEYKWPRNALWNWSRVWEYPYVYYHLKELIRTNEVSRGSLVLDVGTGVTFFPFAVQKLGYNFLGTDIDPICVNDLKKAASIVPTTDTKVDAQAITENKLPAKSNSADIVTCISVLEHIPDFKGTIAEIARVVREGGTFIITIDLDLRGDSEIGFERYTLLMNELKKYFTFKKPVTTVHPSDLLTTVNSSYPIPMRKGLRAKRFVLKEYIRQCLGRTPRNLISVYLAVEGMVLTRNSSGK